MQGPAWSMSSGYIWSEPGALPGFSFWRASANSAGENSLVKKKAIKCRDLPEFRGLFFHEPSCLAVSRLVLLISYHHNPGPQLSRTQPPIPTLSTPTLTPNPNSPDPPPTPTPTPKTYQNFQVLRKGLQSLLIG